MAVRGPPQAPLFWATAKDQRTVYVVPVKLCCSSQAKRLPFHSNQRVSYLAMHLEGHLAELDINPLMVLPSGQGVKAVDALVVLRGT